MPADARVLPDRVASDRYDGAPASDLARRLGVPRLDLYAEIGSTMDVAHELGAAGAPAGSLVLADAQTAGRGRQGNSWRSDPGTGIWLTLLDRPLEPSGLDVLSLRAGLEIARALEPFAGDVVRIKWPNDLYAGGRKLAGLLVEVRWRNVKPEWVALGIGINVRVPVGMPNAAGLPKAPSRLHVLAAVVPAVRRASGRSGPLDEGELHEYAERDQARGRPALVPGRGLVHGITADGALALRAANGTIAYYRAGSLVLEEDR